MSDGSWPLESISIYSQAGVSVRECETHRPTCSWTTHKTLWSHIRVTNLTSDPAEGVFPVRSLLWRGPTCQSGWRYRCQPAEGRCSLVSTQSSAIFNFCLAAHFSPRAPQPRWPSITGGRLLKLRKMTGNCNCTLVQSEPRVLVGGLCLLTLLSLLTNPPSDEVTRASPPAPLLAEAVPAGVGGVGASDTRVTTVTDRSDCVCSCMAVHLSALLRTLHFSLVL